MAYNPALEWHDRATKTSELDDYEYQGVVPTGGYRHRAGVGDVGSRPLDLTENQGGVYPLTIKNMENLLVHARYGRLPGVHGDIKHGLSSRRTSLELGVTPSPGAKKFQFALINRSTAFANNILGTDAGFNGLYTNVDSNGNVITQVMPAYKDPATWKKSLNLSTNINPNKPKNWLVQSIFKSFNGNTFMAISDTGKKLGSLDSTVTVTSTKDGLEHIYYIVPITMNDYQTEIIQTVLNANGPSTILHGAAGGGKVKGRTIREKMQYTAEKLGDNRVLQALQVVSGGAPTVPTPVALPTLPPPAPMPSVNSGASSSSNNNPNELSDSDDDVPLSQLAGTVRRRSSNASTSSRNGKRKVPNIQYMSDGTVVPRPVLSDSDSD